MTRVDSGLGEWDSESSRKTSFSSQGRLSPEFGVERTKVTKCVMARWTLLSAGGTRHQSQSQVKPEATTEWSWDGRHQGRRHLPPGGKDEAPQDCKVQPSDRSLVQEDFSRWPVLPENGWWGEREREREKTHFAALKLKTLHTLSSLNYNVPLSCHDCKNMKTINLYYKSL